MHTTNATLVFFAPFPTIAKPELIFFIQAICRPVRSRKRKENQRNRFTSSARPPGLGVVSKLRRRRHLCPEEFTYLRARTQRIAKVTLPGPSLWVNFWSRQTLESCLPHSRIVPRRRD